MSSLGALIHAAVGSSAGTRLPGRSHGHGTAELSHGFVVSACVHDEFRLPEAECAMCLERGHAAKHSVIHEVREAPFHRLFDIRTRRMNDLAKVRQYGLREYSRIPDVRIDTSVACSHACARLALCERAAPSA